MIGRRLSALALLLSCASAPLQASVDQGYGRDCWNGVELDALKVQRFKTMLLVAMLNCRDLEPAMAADYNRFVRANRDLIARKQSVVREHFIRTMGPSAGLNAYSAFETSLGNRYSDADFDEQRCAGMAQDARFAGYVSEGELMDLIQSVPDEDRLAVCAAEPRYVARREWAPPQPPIYAEPAAAPAPELAVAAPPPPAPMAEKAAEPVQTAQNEWPDLAPVEPEGPARAVDPDQVRLAEAAPPPAEPAAEPVKVAALDVSKPDRVQAVREAARALREALAALEAGEADTAN
ncbi:hypothetical protein HJG53_15395 [Sphingomonas sp. ID1715]|uniref:hypothetical protein n=1 Tax=Sphingomonas sp. ID1715 TaxID=1656898 RepID=UPI001489C998|nr:hypothetical protein [Sphingomonas sp. ID1715]NNM78277.1 hypothetical protein [Sphingomonas sp. ID1715]